jgi:hypothetical protein
MFVDRCPHTSAWRVSAVIKNQRVSRRYMGYTKEEAIIAFEMEFNL